MSWFIVILVSLTSITMWMLFNRFILSRVYIPIKDLAQIYYSTQTLSKIGTTTGLELNDISKRLKDIGTDTLNNDLKDIGKQVHTIAKNFNPNI